MTEPTLAQLERIDLAQKLQTIAEAKYLKTEAQLLAEGFTTSQIQGIQLEAIMQGNIVHYDPNDPTKTVGALQTTEPEAKFLLEHYDILEAYPNDASGLSTVLLRDRDTGKYVMTVRSTEFPPKVGPNGEQLQGDKAHDVPADRELAANGFALAQIDRATSLLDSWVTKYNIGANQVQSVGYSLSGNITMTLNKLRPGYFDQTEGANIVFNSTGLGYIQPLDGGNAYVAALQTFRDMLYSPDAISNFNVDWDPRLSALPGVFGVGVA